MTYKRLALSSDSAEVAEVVSRGAAALPVTE